MTEIKLTKRYPQSRTEDITDAYMRGWNDALDAVQNGKFHIAEQTEPQADCKSCKYHHEEWFGEECDSCCEYSDWQPKDEPTISKMEQVDEPERNMAEDIVESFGFKAESYRQAKAKTEQTERSE